ncbi:MAG: glycoside hydrolase family 3 protein [Clostridia bacterium]|nr:glycoside hydrolase family 3 protein [Clostridia bacterium]
MKKPQLSELTLREKIGQMMAPHQWGIFGKEETAFDFKPVDIEDVKKRCEKDGFGTLRAEQIGVYYTDSRHFSEYIDPSADTTEGNLLAYGKLRMSSDVYREYNKELCSFFKIPPLVAGDCVTGASNVFTDLSSICNALTIGAADDEELTYELGRAIAREMRYAGFNWRWCPVMDMANRNRSTVSRTFAMDDYDRCLKLSKAYVRGMQEEGLAAAVKHFPGTDRYNARDAHYSPVSILSTMDEWWAEQGRAFQEMIDFGAYSVMISHTSFPAADDTMINGQPIPSTISKKIITDLLKEKMGFKGVVITDGISMAGLYSIMPYEELIVALVNAGNDVILGSEMNSSDIIEAAVRDGRIAESRIDDACQRVLDMKEKLGLFEDDYYTKPYPYTREELVANTREINEKIVKKSMTLVRDRQNILPFNKENVKRVSIIVSSHLDNIIEKLEPLKLALEARGMEVHIQRRLKSTAELKEISDNSDLIIYAAYVAMFMPSGYPRLFGEECQTFYYAFKHGKEKSVGVSFGYPYIHYDSMEAIDAFVNANNIGVDSQEAFVEALFGEIGFDGNSPVDLFPRANTL